MWKAVKIIMMKHIIKLNVFSRIVIDGYFSDVRIRVKALYLVSFQTTKRPV